jgi:tetratricopeptide (TPR) repeat protein
MEQIMSAHIVRPSSRWLRAILGAVVALAALLPVSQGFLHGQNQSPAPSATHRANDAAVQRAESFFDQGKFQEAEDLFRQIYILDPQDPRGIIGLVESYVSEGRPADAVQFAQEEAAKHPERTDLRTALADLYVRTDQDDRAIAEFQELLALDRNPTHQADLLFRLGEANRRKGDLNEALRLFQAAADANPKDTKALTRALLQIALLLDGTGRRDEAGPVYEQILKVQPDQPVALNNLAYIVAEQGTDPGRALDLAQRAARQIKDSPEVQDTLGMAYLKKNQPDQAVAAFRAALQSQPQNAAFHYHLGLALLPIGERDAAIQEFQTALADNPPASVAGEVHDLLNKVAP